LYSSVTHSAAATEACHTEMVHTCYVMSQEDWCHSHTGKMAVSQSYVPYVREHCILSYVSTNINSTFLFLSITAWQEARRRAQESWIIWTHSQKFDGGERREGIKGQNETAT